MFFTKFFDADAEGQTSVATETSAPSILSLMATQGIINETEQQVATPIEIPETVEEATSEATESAVAAVQEVQDEVPETVQETASPIIPEAVTTPVVPQQEVSWQEVLKKQQPQSDAILKELGFDDKLVGFINHWKNNGDVTAYLRELTTDYTKMPAEEVMKHQLKLEYPNASERAIEVLYEEEVLNKYKLTDDFSEDEQERGRLLLDAKSEKYRNELVNNQQKYLIPKPAEPQPPSVDPQVEMTSKMLETNRSSVVNSPFYQQVISNNKLTIGEGEEAFNFPVDANELPNIIYDPIKFVENMFEVSQGQNGEINLKADPRKQLLVAAVAKYGEQIFVEYAKHHKAIGSKKAIDPIENPSQPNKSTPTQSEAPPKSAAEAMARHGKLSWS